MKSDKNLYGKYGCSICLGILDVHRHPITGEVYWNKGHNAEPVNSGRCCDKCNYEVVIAERIKRMSELWK